MRLTLTYYLTKIALIFFSLSFLVQGQQQAPPDVYLKWMAEGLPITVNSTMTIPLPQTGITKYNYHYVYLFFNGTCVASDIVTFGGSLIGTVPGTLGPHNLFIGGVLNAQQPFSALPSSATAPPVQVLKGNGSVNSLQAKIIVTALGPIGCTLSVLYKGTIKEEEGVTPAGMLVPEYVNVSNIAIAPTVTTSGAITTYTYPLISNAGTGYALYAITWCVLPRGDTGIFRATTPVSITASTNTNSTSGLSTPYGVGVYTITNGCFTLSSPVGVGALAILNGFATDGSPGTLSIKYTFPTAAGYPAAGELVATAFMKAIY